MKKLAPRLGVSNVWVAKACRHADIPVPERGYWARLQASKAVLKRPLPQRGLGMSDTVVIGRDSYQTHEEIAAELLAKPIEPPPPFAEDMSQVAERVWKMIAKVMAPATFAKVHPLIARLLDED